MTKRILLIEDDKAVLSMLEDILRHEGFSVASERDGEWGLRCFEQQPVDLVILDLLLPKLKGFDLLKRIREHATRGSTPVIAISGVYRGVEHERRLVRDHAAAAFLEKPIDMERLRAALHDVFGADYPARRGGMPPPRLVTPLPARVSTQDLAADEFAQGDLGVTSFARVFGGLAASRATGTLLLRKGTIKKIIYFRRGMPVFVKSNLLHECLGRLLVQERMITEDQCARSLEGRKGSSKRQGELLVEMGAISRANLDFGLELQLETKLFELFSWLEGTFQFVPKDAFEGDEVALSASAAALIYEGARRAMGSDRIDLELGRLLDQPLAASDDPTVRYQASEIDPRAEGLLARVDGKRTLRLLLDAADFDREDAELLCFALICANLLVVVPDSPAVSAPLARLDDPKEAKDFLTVSTAEILAVAHRSEASPIALVARAPSLSRAFDDISGISSITGKERLDTADFLAMVEQGDVEDLRADRLREEGEREQMIEALLERFKGVDAATALGLTTASTPEDVVAARDRVLGEHNLRVLLGDSRSPRVRHLAELFVVTVRRLAQDLLEVDSKRSVSGTNLGLTPAFAAEHAFRTGLSQLAQGDRSGALESIREAVRLVPKEGVYLAYLGWVIFDLDPDDEAARNSALAHLDRAVAAGPRTLDTYLLRAKVLLRVGHRTDALPDLERALRIEPMHSEALELIKGIRPPPRKKSGFLSRLTS